MSSDSPYRNSNCIGLGHGTTEEQHRKLLDGIRTVCLLHTNQKHNCCKQLLCWHVSTLVTSEVTEVSLTVAFRFEKFHWTLNSTEQWSCSSKDEH